MANNDNNEMEKLLDENFNTNNNNNIDANDFNGNNLINNENNNNKNTINEKMKINEQNEKKKNENKLISRDEYTASLRQWMYQCYFWNQFRFLNQSMLISSAATLAFTQQASNNNINNNNSITPTNAQQQRTNQDGIYRIPKLWKRAAAEFVDFMILFLIKAIITYIVIDYFELFDDFKDNIITFDGNFDPYKMTSHLTILELIHRLIVIIFETIFIYKGHFQNGQGNSTPGKFLFKLKVISCTEVLDYGNGEVRVYSTDGIALWRCLVRAFVKSLSTIILPPTLIALYASQFHRGLCDYVAMTIVVEERT